MSKRIYPVTVENGELVESNEKLTVNGLPIAKDGTIDSSYVSGSSSEWTVDANGNLVPKDGEPVQVGSLRSDEVFSAEPNVNYGNPAWLARTDARVFHTWFESLDGYAQSTSGSATVSVGQYNLTLDTGTTSGSVAELKKAPINAPVSGSFDTNWTIRTTIDIRDADGSRIDYYTVADVAAGSAGFGFKLASSTLQGVVHDGTGESTVNLVSSPGTGERALLAEFTAGSDVTFYVDGAESGQLTSGLPSGGGGNRYLAVHTENTSGVQRRLSTSEYRLVQHP